MSVDSTRWRIRHLVVILCVLGIPASLSANGDPELLTEPFLQAPTEDSVRVAWFTEFEGSDHFLVYADALDLLSDPDAVSRARLLQVANGGGTVAVAQTTQLSRVREDLDSHLTGRVYHAITGRQVWRHEARAGDLSTGRRLPYAVVTFREDGRVAISGTYTLGPKPAVNASATILLTSDHQAMPMTPAAMQKVEETVGRVDAVFFAGDLVNVPDRASEWFDDARGGAFFPTLQGRAVRVLTSDGESTVFRGGQILQYAPLYAAIGNHEVMGRTGLSRLSAEFAAAVPRSVARAGYDRLAGRVNPSGDPAAAAQWIENHSHNVDTYLELFTLPESSAGGEMYYAETIGNVRLVVLYATRIWRSWDNTGSSNSSYSEATAGHGDRLAQGWGRHIFEPVTSGSPQYEWLVRELESEAFQSADHTIVMLHHPLHSIGANVVPPFTDPVRVEERNESGEITRIRYEYPKEENYLIRDLQPLFEEAGVDLVFTGHNHLWTRFEGPTGVIYLETSNVGNSYGAFVTGGAGRTGIPGLPWRVDNYDTYDDPYGLEPIVPSVQPLVSDDGRPLPYVAESTVTTFTILRTQTGTVTTYAFDTTDPDSAVWVLDEFRLE